MNTCHEITGWHRAQARTHPGRAAPRPTASYDLGARKGHPQTPEEETLAYVRQSGPARAGPC
jgi:hypothetical protein